MQIPKNTYIMTCQDVLQSLFDINQHDIAVLNKLRELGETQTQILAKHMNKDRSTIYRSLQKLTNCGICQKRKQYLPKGGYYFLYRSTEITQVKQHLQHCINQWYTQMQQTLKQLESELF